jgi:hypothetical protein
MSFTTTATTFVIANTRTATKSVTAYTTTATNL